MCKKWCLAAFIILCVFHANAGDHPLGDSSNNLYIRKLSTSYPARNELFLERLKSIAADKKVLKYYESSYGNIFKGVNEMIGEGLMVYHPVISPLLEKILVRIKDRNSSVPDDVQVLLVRENVPNAYTVGDNTLFVNVGLLYYMKSEDQVAAVLAHEISHLVFFHSIKSLAYNYKKNKENINVVKEIRQSEVNRTDRALETYRKSIYKEGKLERKYELQADSMACVLLKNAGYSNTGLIEALKIIDLNDTIDHGDLAISSYKIFFDLPDQKFNDKWLEMEDFTSYNYEAYKPKFDQDSLSSHPGVDERIRHLTSFFPELSGGKSTSATGAFAVFNSAAENERLTNLYYAERYGEAVYLSLLYLQVKPDDTFYKKWLGISLRKIYDARKTYQLNKYLDRVSPKDQSESYIRFLNFMWNLKPDELKGFVDYYTSLG
ncbi:MAG TPA: M48 family metallopeptidase [Flavipsychrobacter sp.]